MELADDHDPELRGIGPHGPPYKSVPLHPVSAVPGHEVFHAVGVTDDQSVRMIVLADAFQGSQGDQVFDPEDAPEGNQQGEHHGQPGVNGAGDEIGGKMVLCQPGTRERAKSQETTL